MSLRFREGHRVFVFSEYTDMRCGFCKLGFYVREKMGADLLDGDLFLFIGKTRKLLKAICYDGTGLLLFAKRLERGKFMKIEDLDDKAITAEELDLLLRGSQIRRQKFGSEALTNKASVSSMPMYAADRT